MVAPAQKNFARIQPLLSPAPATGNTGAAKLGREALQLQRDKEKFEQQQQHQMQQQQRQQQQDARASLPRAVLQLQVNPLLPPPALFIDPFASAPCSLFFSRGVVPIHRNVVKLRYRLLHVCDLISNVNNC